MAKMATKRKTTKRIQPEQVEQPKVEQPAQAEKPSLTHEELLAALYFCWDAFERSTLNFFLIRDTAKQVKANGELSGDYLSIGVRRMEWNGGQQRILADFLEHEHIVLNETPEGLVFMYKNVPIYLNVYEENPTLEGLDTVFYGNETFLTPNPLSLFEEKYDI